MSGRWLTIIAVGMCLALVAFALWQRSRTTAHVRQFWGSAEAHLIQHGASVKLRVGDGPWQDISRAPGLVHLRATLVDDRYYRWTELRAADNGEPTSIVALQFAEADQSIELNIEPDSGLVTNSVRQQSVPLIPASQKAVAAYLQEIIAH